MFSAGSEDTLDINVVAVAPQQLTPRHVAKDGRMRICNSAKDALGLRLTVFAELAVHTRYDEIEPAQDLFRII